MIELFPGGYLYLTRIVTGRGLISYVWLEFLPAMLIIGAADLHLATCYAIAHAGYLSIYELGYLHNDRCATADERSDAARPTITVTPLQIFAMTVTRVMFVLLVMATLSRIAGNGRTMFYGGLCITGLALLILHSGIGVCIERNDTRRWISFGWLAWFKYLPGLVASVPLSSAVGVSLALFLVYGGGRVVEYAINKHVGQVRIGAMDTNASWFLVALPIFLGLHWLVIWPPSIAPGIVAIGLHHLLATLARLQRPAIGSMSDGDRLP